MTLALASGMKPHRCEQTRATYTRQVDPRSVRLILAAGSVFALSTLSGCAPVDDSDDSVVEETSADELRRGFVTSLRPEVGRVTTPSGGSCTGTLVSPRAVITAAHCVNYASNAAGGSVIGSVRFTRSGVTRTYSYDGYRSFGTSLGGDDIALLHMVSAVPSTAASPATISNSAPARGSRAYLYGYGRTGCDDRGEGGSSDGQKRVYAYNWGDDPEAVCPGDSGGPTFVNNRIVAITSGIRWIHFIRTWDRTDIFASTPDDYAALTAQIRAWN